MWELCEGKMNPAAIVIFSYCCGVLTGYSFCVWVHKSIRKAFDELKESLRETGKS